MTATLNFMIEERSFFDWTIPVPPSSEICMSPCFNFQGTKCKLEFIYLYKDTHCIMNYLFEGKPSTPYHIAVRLLNADDNTYDRKRTVPTVVWRIQNSIDNIWGCRSDVLDLKNRRSFCFRIALQADPQCYCQENTEHSPEKPQCLDSPCLVSLSKDLGKLVDSPESSHHDVQLKCGDHIIKAHRSILSCRSQVFSAMLQSDMLEKRTGEVEIQGMDGVVFQEFIHYLYTGTLAELTVDKATKLYEVGDKYAIEALMRRCANFLTENMSLENACACLSLADAHSDEGLKEKAISYITNETIRIDDENWLAFCEEYPKLALEVFSRGYRMVHSQK